MLSKCANPECSASFRYLHEGRIFYLAPTPDLQIAMGMRHPALHERFWLCLPCSKAMTLIWGGSQVRLAPLPTRVASLPLPSAAKSMKNEIQKKRLRARAATAGREDR